MTSVPGRSGCRRQSPAPGRRRGDLLDAATQLFAANGVEATSVAAITAKAGVSKGNFYRYFTSREELMAALRSRFIDDLVAEIAGFGERIDHGDWWTLVDDFVATMIGALLDRRALIGIFAAQPSTPASADLFVDGAVRIDELLASGIERGVAEGVFHVVDPAMTAALVHQAISATVVESITNGVEVDSARLTAAAQRLTRAALHDS